MAPPDSRGINRLEGVSADAKLRGAGPLGRLLRNGTRAGGAALLLLIAGAAAAQTPAPEMPAADAPAPASLEPDLSAKQNELHGIEDFLKASDAQRRKLEAEIESIGADRARLNAAMIETTARVQAAETKVATAQQRLETATASETAIRRSLASRKDVIAEVLAILQRMGRKPPPAVLASPDDMLQAIRTSMLLSAVLPGLRSEIEVLAADLQDLSRARAAVAAERDALAKDATALGEERQRIAALIDARQSSQGEAERALAAERERASDLARQALDLKELIARMESESAAAAKAAEAARKADEANRRTASLGPPDSGGKPNASPFKDAARLAPAIAFADAKGLLPLPAAGAITKTFGAPDGFGGSEKGLSIATQPNALVASPTDGWIAFSGPYRTYGQLLIVNAGGGYYVVLAGMSRINVEVGQFVLAGEPVASMGDGSAKTATAIAVGASQPVLYVEFRKDGAAVDPSPWWAKSELEKVRG
jgi:septal ring factor EnvC (AmiA/AmiB activator)